MEICSRHGACWLPSTFRCWDVCRHSDDGILVYVQDCHLKGYYVSVFTPPGDDNFYALANKTIFSVVCKYILNLIQTFFVEHNRGNKVNTISRDALTLPSLYYHQKSLWRHQMETFSALLPICAGNSPVTGEFPTQRPVTRSFNVFFAQRLNQQLSNGNTGVETPSRSLWRHSNMLSQTGFYLSRRRIWPLYTISMSINDTKFEHIFTYTHSHPVHKGYV